MQNLVLSNGMISRRAVTAAAAGVLIAGAIIAGVSRTPSRGRVLGALELESIFGDGCTACCAPYTCSTATLGYGGTKCVKCDSTASRFLVCPGSDMLGTNTSCSWGTNTPCGSSTWEGGTVTGTGICGTCTSASFAPGGMCSNVVQAAIPPGIICNYCD